MTIKQLSSNDWQDVGFSFYLCTFNLYPQDIEERFGIEFFQYEEEGLGLTSASVIQIENTKFWLFAAVNESGLVGSDDDSDNSSKDALKVSVRVLSYCADTKLALDLICHVLQVEPSSLNAVNKNLGPGKWRLTRLDDNGNEIEMYVFQEEHCARAVRTLFERRGHKQDYYVNEIT